MTPILEARGITKVFGGGLFQKNRVVALDNISFTVVERPTITAVAGESGSGKTTLARVLLGDVEPDRGRVLYRGLNLRSLTRHQRFNFRREVQAIFQDPFEVYNPFYRVDSVLDLPIRKFKLAKSKQDRRRLAEKVLEKAGLRPDETLGRYPHQLSGGQRQRVMVARAMLVEPRVIIADEPVSMVDASLRATILEALFKFKTDLGISILYITHDLTTAFQISEQIIVLYRGSVAESGDVASVIRNPEHPYTKLLVGSIPLPDPTKRWSKADHRLARNGSAKDSAGGCKFAGRCPSVMPMCRSSPPPLYQTSIVRSTACYLYRGSGVPEVEEIERPASH